MEIKQGSDAGDQPESCTGRPRALGGWGGGGTGDTDSQREETEREGCGVGTTARPCVLTHVSLLCAHVHSLPVRRPVCHRANVRSCVPGHRRFAHTSGSLSMCERACAHIALNPGQAELPEFYGILAVLT